MKEKVQTLAALDVPTLTKQIKNIELLSRALASQLSNYKKFKEYPKTLETEIEHLEQKLQIQRGEIKLRQMIVETKNGNRRED